MVLSWCRLPSSGECDTMSSITANKVAGVASVDASFVLHTHNADSFREEIGATTSFSWRYLSHHGVVHVDALMEFTTRSHTQKLITAPHFDPMLRPPGYEGRRD